ncbi:MAG TPA: hypothetical protein VI197_31285 [Polyangiaceae bacterium]
MRTIQSLGRVLGHVLAFSALTACGSEPSDGGSSDSSATTTGTDTTGPTTQGAASSTTSPANTSSSGAVATATNTGSTDAGSGGGGSTGGGTTTRGELPALGCNTELAVSSGTTPQVVSDRVIEYTLDGEPARDHYRVAILMFDGQTTPPEDASGWSHTEYTPEMVGEAFFNDPNGVAAYMAEASYGKVSLEGTVVGWFDIGAYTAPVDEIVLDYETYAAMALDDIDFADYDITYIVAVTDTDELLQIGWGLGNSVQGVYPMGIDYMINSWFWNEAGTRAHSSTALPSTSWAHELSHTLGLTGHAIGLDCGDQIVSTECILAPYANPFSIMGAYIYGTHQDVRGKLAMNFVDAAQLQEVTASGSYGVCPLETTDAEVKGLSITLPQTLTLTESEAVYDRLIIEYRTPIGFDRYLERLSSDFVTEFFPAGPLDHDGISLMLGYANESDSTVLMDVHPDTEFTSSGIKVSGDGGKYADARLRLGETVTLEVLGLEVTYEGRTTDGGVMVRVTYL